MEDKYKLTDIGLEYGQLGRYLKLTFEGGGTENMRYLAVSLHEDSCPTMVGEALKAAGRALSPFGRLDETN